MCCQRRCKEITQTAQRAEILSKLVRQTADQGNASLKGIRAVYIQYRTDREAAVRIRTALQNKGVSVPRLELVPTILQNDIRYPGPDEKEAAQQLKTFLASSLQVEVPDDKLIDLSTRGYRVPSGQFEIWINK